MPPNDRDERRQSDRERERRTVPPSPFDSPPRPPFRDTRAKGEDPPPLARSSVLRESTAQIALRAPLVESLTSEQRILQALAQTEQSMHRESEERARAFEDTIKAQIRSIVTTEVKHSTPPPPPLPPEKSMWAHVGPHLPAIIAAMGAVIVSMSQSCGPAVKAITDRLDRIEKKQDTLLTQRIADLKAQHDYDLKARYWMQDVLERLDVKIDDPLGAPDRDPEQRLKFWPEPKIDPHKVQKGIAAPRVQPQASFPLPPPLPEKKEKD